MRSAYIPALLALLFLSACDGPHNAASTRISTAPMSHNPTESMPATGTNKMPSNKVTPETGTAPADKAIPKGENPNAPDSTAKR